MTYAKEGIELCERSDLPAALCAHCAGVDPDFEIELDPIDHAPELRKITGNVIRSEYQSILWASSYNRLPKKPDGEDRYLSQEQIDHLTDILDDLPQLLTDLDIAITKQVRFPQRKTIQGDGTEAPIDFDEQTSNARRNLSRAILEVSDLVWKQVCPKQPAPWLLDVTAAAAWLAGSLDQLALRQDAEQHAIRITLRARNAHRAIDRPKDIRYLGECPKCQADLEAEHGAKYVICRNQVAIDQQCDWAGEVDQILRDGIARGLDMLFTDTELVAAVQVRGKPLKRRQIQYWADKERLEVHICPRWSRSTGRLYTVKAYKLSEVLALVDEHEQRKRKKAS